MADLFVKLYKKMLQWEWFDDVNTCHLFVYCLLKAEWYPGSWHGIPYEAGQFITSLERLTKETGLSMQQVRTSLKHLISTGELTSFQQGRARIITVVKWDEYQSVNKETNKKLTGNQQGSNKKLTPCKEYKNKEYKNKRYTHSQKSKTDFDALAEELKE